MAPMPSHPIAPTTPPPIDYSTRAYDMGKGALQSLGNTALMINDSVLPFMADPVRNNLEAWATPQTGHQFMGQFLTDLATPGPEELALLGAKGAPLLGMAMADFDKVAARMGKPAGSITSKLEHNINENGEWEPWAFKVMDSHPYPGEIGGISFKNNPVENYLSVGSTWSNRNYHNAGLGTAMYKDAMEKAQELGYQGIASRTSMRGPFSNEIWNRPGIETKNLGTRGWPETYEFMKEYIPRGKDWEGTHLEKLFTADRLGDKPMIPEVKNTLLDEMRSHPVPFETRPRPDPYAVAIGPKPPPPPTFEEQMAALIEEEAKKHKQFYLPETFDASRFYYPGNK
jgi:hypothetical protein